MKRVLFTIAFILIALLLFLGFKKSGNKLTLEITGHRVNLAEAVDKALFGAKGSYAVAIKNLKTGEEYYRDENKIYDAGSLYKLATMLAVFEQIERGEISEDEIITGNVSDINRIMGVTNEEAEVEQETIEFTIKNALRQMITISHNYAAALLTQKVGVVKAQEAINRLGLKNTLIDSQDKPKITARDLLMLFEKIYKREGVSAYVSARALDLLLEQELNDRIPKYLPGEAKVAHKTAEIDYQKHDAGIVFTLKGDYVIVVLSESDNPSAASERIANLSKEVYEYFNKKN